MENRSNNTSTMQVVAAVTLQTNENIKVLAQAISELQENNTQQDSSIADITRRLEKLEADARKPEQMRLEQPKPKEAPASFTERHKHTIKNILNTYRKPEDFVKWFMVMVDTIAAQTTFASHANARNSLYHAFDEATKDRRIEDKYTAKSLVNISRIEKIARVESLRPIMAGVVLDRLHGEMPEKGPFR